MNVDFAGGMFFFTEYAIRFRSAEHFYQNEQLNCWWANVAKEKKQNVTLHVYYHEDLASVKYTLCMISARHGSNLDRVIFHCTEPAKTADLMAEECTVYIPALLDKEERNLVCHLMRRGLKILWSEEDVLEMLRFNEPFDPGPVSYFLKRPSDYGYLWYSIVEVDPGFVERAHVGYGSKLYKAYISFTRNASLHIGRASYISVNPHFFLEGEFRMGNFCQVSTDFTAITRRHSISSLSLGRLAGGAFGYFGEGHDQVGDIVIGHDVWIGTRVLVLPGVTIGNGCVIGAGSVVTKDCIPYGIYAGNPAQFIKFRFSEEKIAVLMESKWWDWPLRKIYANRELFLEKVESLEVSELRSMLNRD